MVAMTDLEHMLVAFTTSSAGTGVNTRECVTACTPELMEQLTVWACDPARLIPNGPPVHRVLMQVCLGSTPLSLLTSGATVAHVADTLAIVSVAFATGAIAVFRARQVLALVSPGWSFALAFALETVSIT